MKRIALAIAAALALTLPASAAVEYYKGATATHVASGTSDAQAVAAATDLRFLGFSCKEDAAAPASAEFIIRNGTTASDPPVAFVKLAASESVRDYLGQQGISCPNGIFIDRVSGTTDISIYSRQ